MILEAFAATCLPEVEAEMRQVVSGPSEDALPRFMGTLHYHLGWVDRQFRPEVDRPHSGKRIRPLLCLLAAAATGADWRPVTPAAAAIELIHNFSLIHDDIQDQSPLRHGRPALWSLWGTAQAINSGDAMFAMAHLAMERLVDRGVSAARTLAALALIDRICVAITEGQFLDLDFESRTEVGVAEYLAMIGRKTASLLAAAAELGAFLAGAEAWVVSHYRDFAFHLGLAFQVRDDVLGIWGSSDIIGKSTTTDLQRRKKSLPVVYGLEHSSEFRKLYSGDMEHGELDAASVQQAAASLEKAGARSYAEEQVRTYSQMAIAALEAAEPQGEAAKALWELTEQLIGRVK